MATSIISRLTKWQEHNPGLFFLVRLIGLFLVLFYSTEFIIAITAPGGSFYSPLADRFFDLDQWFSDFLRGAGGVLVNLTGYSTEVTGNRLVIADTSAVIMGYTCLGFGVLSTWVALILAYPDRKQNQLKWKFLLGGIAGIILLNILRIALLAVIWHQLPNSAREVDHHLIFNLVVYGCIFLGFRKYVKSREKLARRNLVVGSWKLEGKN